MHIRPFLLFTTMVFLPLAHAQGAETHAVTAASSQKTDATNKTNNPVPAAADADYVIGPQDVVRIDVWKETEISRTIPVRPDGKISLPLLNDIQASGLTAVQLGKAIHDGLTKYLTNPEVTVTVTEINSRRVYITGEVARAGAFPLLPNMTVLQALSSAGGFTQFAKTKSIYVLRNDAGKQVKHPFNYKEVVKGKNQEENVLLQPGDVIVVP
ncbi:MAG: polysaccharide biosynthesis/export family protein [Terriglobia bacterium]|jgi:polysaccharide export outer membrane protein